MQDLRGAAVTLEAEQSPGGRTDWGECEDTTDTVPCPAHVALLAGHWGANPPAHFPSSHLFVGPPLPRATQKASSLMQWRATPWPGGGDRAATVCERKAGVALRTVGDHLHPASPCPLCVPLPQGLSPAHIPAHLPFPASRVCPGVHGSHHLSKILFSLRQSC